MKRIALAAVLVVLALGGCPRHDNGGTTIEPGKRDAGSHLLPADDAEVAVPPALPVPAVPPGLPVVTLLPDVTPDAVALGARLFDALACGHCHDPKTGFSGGMDRTVYGKPNLRRTPTLVNLAWRRAYGWAGTVASLDDLVLAHVRGQLGKELGDVVRAYASPDDPTWHVLYARVADKTDDAARRGLEAFVLTRYDGGSPWDLAEHSAAPPADLKAGYELFIGKAQCAVCHPPPLYTDGGYHRLGLVASHDEGHGRVDPAATGAFATPTVRGAAARTAFFHDGSAPTLDAAIDWHLAGGVGQGADPTIIDPALRPISLAPAERAALGAFVRSLTR